MTRTKKTAGQTAKATVKAQKSAAKKEQKAVEVQQPTFISPEELVSFPDDKEEEAQPAGMSLEQLVESLTPEQKAALKAQSKKAEAIKKAADSETLAGTKAAQSKMKEEAVSLSGWLRLLWWKAQPESVEKDWTEADRAKVAADLKAVSGLEPAGMSRKSFTGDWLKVCQQYADAVNAEGRAVSLVPVAGMLKAEPFSPKSLNDIYYKILQRWLKKARCFSAEVGCYYMRSADRKSLAKIAIDKARQIEAEAERRRKALAKGAAAGRAEAARQYDAAKAVAEA